MKYLQILATLSLLTLLACEMPRQSKQRLTDPLTDPFGDGYDFNNNDNNNNSNDDSSDTGTDGGNTTNVTIPGAASHCQWSTDGTTGFNVPSTLIGSYNLCRSQLNENTAYFQIATPISSGSRLCFIPVTRTGVGEDTTYIGQPHCGYFYQSDKIYELNFTISRGVNGNNSPRIDGFMIMKDENAEYPAPYPFQTQGSYIVPGSGGHLYHYNAYYQCIDALELCCNNTTVMCTYGKYYCNFDSAAYCSAFQGIGQYINHYPF